MVNTKELGEIIVVILRYDRNLPKDVVNGHQISGIKEPEDRKQYKWYDYMIRMEFGQNGMPGRYRITHWTLTSSNVEYFMFKGTKFQELMLIFGEKTVYWYFRNIFSKKQLRAFGYKPLEYSRCSCCVHIHLDRLIKLLDLDRNANVPNCVPLEVVAEFNEML